MFGYRIIKSREYEILKAMENKFHNLSDDYNFLLKRYEQEKDDNNYFREQIEKMKKEPSFRPKGKHKNDKK